MKQILSLLTIIFLFGCSDKNKIQAPHNNPIQIALSSSVAFMQYYEEDGETGEDNENEADLPKTFTPTPETKATFYRAYCGGVWVKSDLILTANHCAAGIAFFKKMQKLSFRERMIANADNAMQPDPKKTIGVEMEYIVPSETNGLEGKPKSLHKGRVVAASVEHDFALVKIDALSSPSHLIASLARENPELGEEVLTVGHPGSLLFSFERASVAAYRTHLTSSFEKKGITGPFIQISGFVWRGNSGGGIFNKNGELISLVSFTLLAPNQIFGIEERVLQIFLNDNLYRLFR